MPNLPKYETQAERDAYWRGVQDGRDELMRRWVGCERIYQAERRRLLTDAIQRVERAAKGEERG